MRKPARLIEAENVRIWSTEDRASPAKMTAGGSKNASNSNIICRSRMGNVSIKPGDEGILSPAGYTMDLALFHITGAQTGK